MDNKYSSDNITPAIFKGDIEEIVRKTAIKEIGKEKEIEINEDLFKVVKKYWWKYPNRIDTVIIKFLCNVGWLSSKQDFNRDCNLCKEKEVGREHHLDVCSKTEDIRARLRRSNLISDKEQISKCVLNLFFSQNMEIGPKELRRRMKLVYDTFSDLMKAYSEEENK